MKHISTLAIFSAAILMASCSVQKGSSRPSPVMLPDKTVEWTVEGVAYDNADFSGLAFSKNGKKIIAAFNSAALYWMDKPKEGQPLHFEPFEVRGAQFHVSKRDCECVTVNKNTGDIYYGQERDAKEFKGASIYRIYAKEYNSESKVVTFERNVIPDGNSGIEGLTWIGGDNFIVGREGKWNERRKTQDLEPMMIFFSESKGIYAKVVPSPEIKQIAEVVYDEVRDCLWILDGDYDRVLYRTDMMGQILDRYPIPEIENAEALLLDRKHKCIWIGSDEEPSKLYKIAFKNL